MYPRFLTEATGYCASTGSCNLSHLSGEFHTTFSDQVLNEYSPFSVNALHDKLHRTGMNNNYDTVNTVIDWFRYHNYDIPFKVTVKQSDECTLININDTISGKLLMGMTFWYPEKGNPKKEKKKSDYWKVQLRNCTITVAMSLFIGYTFYRVIFG